MNTDFNNFALGRQRVGANSAPGPHYIHLTPDRLRVTWLTALFGLLLGVTMTYVPYEFQTNAFQPIYAHVRLLGVAFLAPSVAIFLAALYVRRLGWLDQLGRICLIITIAIYWWNVAVIPGSRTGILLYPVMMACLAAEGFLPRRGLFPVFVSLVSIGFGLTMILVPSQFSAATYGLIQPVLAQLGAYCLVAGLGLWLAPWRKDWRWRVVLFGGLTLPFLYLSYAVARIGGWSGMELYAVVALGCLLATVSPWVNPPASVRWRLLRGFVVAGLLPLLVVGGLASYLAQRAIEDQTRDNATRTMAVEADRISQYIDDARVSLSTLAQMPGFISAVGAGDADQLQNRLGVLLEYRPMFRTLAVLDPQGKRLVGVGISHPPSANYADRDFYQQALEAGQAYISKPFLNMDQQPVIVLSLPVVGANGLNGILIGSLLVDDLINVTTTDDSTAFQVQVVDKREGLVLRDTASGRVLEPVDLPETATIFAATAPDVIETYDAGRRYLTAYAPAAGTDWVVLSMQPVSAVYGPITRLSAAVIALVAIAAALALALSQFVALEVTERLASVQAAAGALAAGSLNERVEVEGADELADLGRAFNDMADEIQAGQTELARVNAELQMAVRVRDDFLSVASHEMKTPLTPIKGFAQTLLRQLERTDRPLDRGHAIKVLRMMSLQADRLADLVNDLLDTSRIRSGRFVLAPATMDLAALCGEVAERFASQSEPGGTTISIHAPPGGVQGEWDASRLDQVITNLISNALRYSPEGGEVRIDIEEDADSVELTVSDQGIGIPKESVANLFQPFYRAANATHHYGGLGLGLYISREIVERHGGRIWAESEGPGMGSHFHVSLPRYVQGEASLNNTGDAHPVTEEMTAD